MVLKRVAALGVLGSVLGVSMGGCIARSPVVGEEDARTSGEGSVELIGNAAYFVNTVTATLQSCLPRLLPLDDDGDVLCALYGVNHAAETGECTCSDGSNGLVMPMIGEELEARSLCGPGTGFDCSEFCGCAVPPAEGESKTDCLNNRAVADTTTGWCYVDPSRGLGSDDVIADCPSTQRQNLRIFGSDASMHVITCLGGPVVPGPSAPGPGAVGEPCLPGLERNQSFNGFFLTEVGFEFGSPDCVSNTCLMNHFQGRVSCPYGQNVEPNLSPSECFLPGSDERVPVAVDPQLVARGAAETAICSCRCDGPDPSASYCDCPSDMECSPLVPETGVSGEDAYVGSYCIHRGTRYDMTHPPNPTICTIAEMNCGDPHPY